MSMRIKKQRDELLARRAIAAEWMDTLKGGDRRDHLAFDEWLRESKLNVECYLEMEALDRQVQALDPSDRPDIDAIAAQTISHVVKLDRASQTSHAGASGRSRRFLSIAAVAASIVILISALAVFGYRELTSPDHLSAKTATGEQRMLTLSDGSVIRMNVETVLKVDYHSHQRDIHLVSGEAIFKVAQDAARPFVVHTPTAKVRALGTQFNVYQRHATVVSVLEGRVQISTPLQDGAAERSSPPQRLNAGEEVQITQGRIEKRPVADVAKTAAWREGQLYFDSMPLEDIVREFNRYGGPVRLTVEDIAPGSYRFGGTFNVDEPTSLADILEEQPDLTVERRPGEILIRPR